MSIVSGNRTANLGSTNFVNYTDEYFTQNIPINMPFFFFGQNYGNNALTGIKYDNNSGFVFGTQSTSSGWPVAQKGISLGTLLTSFQSVNSLYISPVIVEGTTSYIRFALNKQDYQFEQSVTWEIRLFRTSTNQYVEVCMNDVYTNDTGFYNISNGTSFQNTFGSYVPLANTSFVLQSDLNGNNWVFFNNSYVNIEDKPVPLLTWPSIASIFSGTALSSTQLNATADVLGTYTYNPPSGTVLSVGNNQILQLVFTPNDTNVSGLSIYNTINVINTNPNITSGNRTADLTTTNMEFLNNFKPNSTSNQYIPVGMDFFFYGTNYGNNSYKGAIKDSSISGIAWTMNSWFKFGNSNVQSPYITSTARSIILGGVTTPPTNFEIRDTTTLYYSPVFIIGSTKYMRLVLFAKNSQTSTPSEVQWEIRLFRTPTNQYIEVSMSTIYSTPTSGTAIFNISNGSAYQNTFSGYTPTVGNSFVLSSDLTGSSWALFQNSYINIQNQILPATSWPTPANIVTFTPLSSIQLNATASVSGSFIYNPPSGTVLPVGTSSLNALFIPIDPINATFNLVNSITVDKITPVITWSTPADINYLTPLPSSYLNASTSTTTGTFYYNQVAGSILSPGNQIPLITTFVATDTTNYNIVTQTVYINVLVNSINIQNASDLQNWLNNPSYFISATITQNISINPSTWTLSSFPLTELYSLNMNGKTISIVPNGANTFSGLMNLKGATISNGVITSDLTNGSVVLASNGIGWLAGNSYASGNVSNVLIYNLSISTNDSGSVAGKNASINIDQCQYGTSYQYGSISGLRSGGFLGSYSNSSKINECLIYSNLSGAQSGGVLGSNAFAFNINKTRIMGTLSNSSQGGFLGSDANSGNIQFCNSQVTIQQNTSGGFVGSTSTQIIGIQNINFEECYYLGTAVSGTGAIGQINSNTNLQLNKLALSTQTVRSGSTGLTNRFSIQSFSPTFTANGSINVIRKDPVSGYLYVGGEFTEIEGYNINRIAMYDGTKWNSLGNGVYSTINPINSSLVNAVNEIIFVNNDIYIGGYFENINGLNGYSNIAKWSKTTSTWSNLLDGVSGIVYKLLYDGSKYIYVGGNFNNVNSTIIANNIARWDITTSTWSAMGSSATNVGTNNPINDVYGVIDMILINNLLYVGGGFTYVNYDRTIKPPSSPGISANRIAIWNTTTNTWSAIISGANNGADNYVRSFLYTGGNLYVAGAFTRLIATSSLLGCAILNTSTNAVTAVGSPVGPGLGTYTGGNPKGTLTGVLGLHLFNGYIFAFGTFYTNEFYSSLTPSSTNYLRYYDISANRWFELTSYYSEPFERFYKPLSDGDNLYLPSGYNKTMKYVSSSLYLYSPSQNNFYNQFSLMANNTINAFAYDSINQILYMAGSFTYLNGITVNRIAQWNLNTQQFSSLGSGVNGIVYALTVSGNNLYVGGSFTTATDSVSTKTVNRIALWNGSVWSALGSGVNNNVRVIRISGNNIWLGGDFTTATDSVSAKTVNRITKWNTSTNVWSIQGSGLGNNSVLTMSIQNNLIYVGGSFTTAGGISASRIGVWNDSTSTWSALGSGYGNNVNSLEMIDNQYLYVGGEATNSLQIYNTLSGVWSIPVSLPGNVKTMIRKNNRLYIGGYIGATNNDYFGYYDYTTSQFTNVPCDGALVVVDMNQNIGLSYYPRYEDDYVVSPYLQKINLNYVSNNFSTSTTNTTIPISDFSSSIWNTGSQPTQLHSINQYPFITTSSLYNGATNLPLTINQPSINIYTTNDLYQFLQRSTSNMTIQYNNYTNSRILTGSLRNDIIIDPSTWFTQLPSLTTGYTLNGNGKRIIIQPKSSNVPWYGFIQLLGGSFKNTTFNLDSSMGSLQFQNQTGYVIPNSYSFGIVDGIVMKGWTLSTNESGLIVGIQSSCQIQNIQIGDFNQLLSITGIQSGSISGTYFHGSISNAIIYANVLNNFSSAVSGPFAYSATFSQCKLNGSLSGTNQGGIVGGSIGDNCIIENCYSLMTISNLKNGAFFSSLDDSHSLTMNNNYYLGNLVSGSSLGSVKNQSKLSLIDFASNTSYTLSSEIYSMITECPLQHIGNNPNNTGALLNEFGALTYVRCMVYDETNQDLYIGGNFNFINNNPMNRIVKWNIPSNTWSSLGSGIGDGEVYTILLSNQKLYIGGDFTSVNGQSISYIAYWDLINLTWNALPTLNNIVHTLAISGNILYVGGEFTNVTRIAYRDISNPSSVWTTLGGGIGIAGESVNTICISGDNIYIGGTFTRVAGINQNYITVWNTVSLSYSSLSTGPSGAVNKIITQGSYVYIVGEFKTVQDSVSKKTVFGTAKWNTNTSLWEPIIDTYGINMTSSSYSVNDIIIIDSQIYLSGVFEYTNNYLSKGFVTYNETTKKFSCYFGNLYKEPITTLSFTRRYSPQILTMLRVNNIIYVGGVFDDLQTPDQTSNIETNLGNLAQIKINYNTDNYSPSYPSSLEPISNFNN